MNKVTETMPSIFAASSRFWFGLTTSGGVTLLLGVACLLALIFQSPLSENTLSETVFAGVITSALLGLDWFVARRYRENPPFHLAVIVVGLHALLVEVMTLIDGFTYTAILYLTLPFPAFFMLGRRVGILISIGSFAWFTLKYILFKPGWLQDPTTMNTYLLFMISLVLIVAMAQVVQWERANRQRAEKLLIDLETSHHQLARYAEQVAEMATIEERNRLARDIHDSLGHYLTVIGVQLEKALVIHDDHPDQSLEAVRNAKRLNDQALTDVRQSVGALRSEQAPFRLRSALETLLANLAGLPFTVNLTINGDEFAYSQQQLLILYRTVQEGLTNIQKHAHAQTVKIQLEFGETGAILWLVDDGVGFVGNPSLNNGLGLRGIKERLEFVGGSLHWATEQGQGTQLVVTIPRQFSFSLMNKEYTT